MKSKLRYINSEDELDQVISYCKKTKYASIDFETNGYPFYHPLFKPTILGISFQPGVSYILPLAHYDSKFLKKDKWIYLLKKFGRQVLEDPNIIKIAWNFKFEINCLRVYDIYPNGRLFDGMLAKYLLKEERPNDLKSIVASFIPRYAGYDLPNQPDGKKSDTEKIVNFWSNVPLKKLSKYCGLDTDLTLRLMMFFENSLIDNGFYLLFRNMLMMATRVLAEAEWYGMPIDEPFLNSLVVKYEAKINEIETDLKNHPKIRKFENSLISERIEKAIGNIEDEILALEDEIKSLKKQYKKTRDNKINTAINRKKKSIQTRKETIDRYIARDIGRTNKELKMLEPVNFNSPDQMISLLFNDKKGFRFKVVRYTIDKNKRETERPSTDESVLEELALKDDSGFIKKLLEYRGTVKLYSTYIIGMKKKLGPDKKIHGSFLIHGTVTGRLSSQNPNLQNIPRDTTAEDIKKMFIPPKGMVLLQADYSQAELRVLASQANETEMIRWFKEGRDIHLAVACDKNKWDYDWAKEILDREDKSDPNYFPVKTQRKYAKTINFGIVYGQTAKKLSLGMECSLEEAEKYLIEYNRRFPNISSFIKKQHKLVSKNGYVRNLFGRKRRLPNIYSDDWGKKAEAQRQSVNAPIQGAASDYALFSSILIWEKIKNGELPSTMVEVYTVHDSLGYFVYPEDLKTVVPKIEEICSNPETKEWFNFQIDSVRMQVDFEISHLNWKELKTYHEDVDYVKLVKELN